MKFTLTKFPNGRALLSTPTQLTLDEVENVRAAWEHWITTENGLAVITECEIEHSVDIDLEVGA